MRVVTTTRKIRIDDNEMARQLLEGIQDQPDQLSRSETPQQTARIDVVQTEVDERPTERTQELPTPAEFSTPELALMKTPVSQFMQTPTPTFTGKLERIIIPQRFLSPLKYKMTPKRMMVRRFQFEIATPGGSDGLDTMLDPAPSSSRAISEGGTSGSETPTPTTRMSRPPI